MMLRNFQSRIFSEATRLICAVVSLSTSLGMTALAVSSASALALDWSDTSASWRHGSRFAEPFNNQNIAKNIFGLTHVNGYAYGSNFLSADFLLSDDKDPSRFGSSSGARETYVVYRHTLDLGKVRGNAIKFGLVRGLGLTAGFDWNTKKDSGYNSRKRMFAIGPTLMMDVPGFLDVSLLSLHETNHPSVSPGAFDPGYPASRYRFKTHPMLGLVWGIPLSDKLSYEGYANFIAAKGRDETGAATAAETNIDMQLMVDVSEFVGAGKKAFKLGVQYQYWKNKFGNNASGPPGRGAYARTPMLRAEYHF